MKTNQIKKYVLFVLLVCAGISIFYACKKKSEETQSPLYLSELKTYHESSDYKNLLALYPNGIFENMPIVDVNPSMKAILTKVISKEGETVTAMTYFVPVKERNSNIWYPTIILRMKADEGKDLKKMLQEKNLFASIEVGTTNNETIHSLKYENNSMVSEERISDGLKKSFVAMKDGGKHLMEEAAAGGILECIKQADICATNKFKDLGYLELAACLIAPAPCMGILFGDCFLHEEACLGLEKPVISYIS